MLKRSANEEHSQAAVRQVLSTLDALPEAQLDRYSKVERALKRACPPKLFAQLKFSDRFEAQLVGTVAKLAALAIYEITSETLKAHEGKVAALPLGHAIGALVLTQYQ